MGIDKSYLGPVSQTVIDTKRRNRMAAIDALPKATRELVHVYGYHVVDQFRCLGVSDPKHIRHLVETVLNDFSPTRGSYSQQGIRTQHDTDRE